VTLAAVKAAARSEAFARRKAAFAARHPDDSMRLIEVLRAEAGRVLSGYMPMRTEIDCLPAMAAHDGLVGVPVILGQGQALAFRAWSPGAAMTDGPFGAQVPAAGPWVLPEVLIVPLLAFDAQGYRLGYGGGFYDRTLQGLRGNGPVLAVGFGFDAQEVAQVPREPTDERLDLIVTPTRVLRTVPGSA
jgi:5-formyltetrahydrofolate cyclo-ligase